VTTANILPFPLRLASQVCAGLGLLLIVVSLLLLWRAWNEPHGLTLGLFVIPLFATGVFTMGGAGVLRWRSGGLLLRTLSLTAMSFGFGLLIAVVASVIS
jgi:hypothetical protein